MATNDGFCRPNFSRADFGAAETKRHFSRIAALWSKKCCTMCRTAASEKLRRSAWTSGQQQVWAGSVEMNLAARANSAWRTAVIRAHSRLAAMRHQGCSVTAPGLRRQMPPASPNTTFLQGAMKALLRARELSRKPSFSRRWRP